MGASRSAVHLDVTPLAPFTTRGGRPRGLSGLLAVLSACLLSGVTPAAVGGGGLPALKRGDLQSYFAQADYWLRGREPRRAEAVLGRAAALFPWEPRAHLTAAALFFRDGRFSEAAARYAAASRLRPRDPAPLLGLARAEYSLRRYPRAEAALRRAVRLDPRSAAAQAELGMVYADEFATEKALGCLHAALEVDPGSVEAHYYLAELLRRLRRLDEAEPHARQALAAAPNNAGALVTLGRIYLERPDTEANRAEAVDAFRRATALDPSRAEAFYSLGLLYQRERSWREAESCLLRAIAIRSDLAPACYTLSLVERRLGKYGAADRYLARFRSLRPARSAAAPGAAARGMGAAP